MTLITERGDALQWFATGAVSDGADISDRHDSLGGYRSSLRLGGLGFRVDGGPRNLQYDWFSPACGPGEALVEALSADSLAFTPPGGSQGAAVSLSHGETRILEGADAGAYAQVTRTSADDLEQTAVLTLLDGLGELFSDVLTAVTVAGGTKARCLALKNASSTVTLTGIRLWLAAVGDLAAVDAAGYAASGAITIDAGGSTRFVGWPQAGVVLNETTDEGIYYTERTGSRLTVPAAGRDVWSEGAAAGTEGDVLRPLPPLRLGIEAPSSQPSGSVTLLGDEATAVPVSLYHPTSAADAILVPPLAAGNIYGVWIERAVVAGSTALPTVLEHIGLRFEGET